MWRVVLSDLDSQLAHEFTRRKFINVSVVATIRV